MNINKPYMSNAKNIQIQHLLKLNKIKADIKERIK